MSDSQEQRDGGGRKNLEVADFSGGFREEEPFNYSLSPSLSVLLSAIWKT